MTPIQEKTVMASKAVREEAPDAEAAGSQYAQAQLEGDYFMDWVREQLAEADRMDPDKVLPLETKQDALVIAKNMLKQLEWDTKRDLPESKEFFVGFRETLDSSRDWLADELLQMKGEMGGGVVEARRTKRHHPDSQPRYKPTRGVKLRVVDRVVPSHNAHRVEFQDGLSIQVHGGSGRDDLLYAMKPTDMRHEKREPGPESRREYQYAALKAVLGDRPADFVVDRDGDVRAVLTAVVRESRMRARNAAPVEDPEYIIQGLYNDGSTGGGFDEHGFDDEATAIAEAQKIARSNWFEGDYVRIITRDGELVWDSRGGGAGESPHRPTPTEPRTRRSKTTRHTGTAPMLTNRKIDRVAWYITGEDEDDLVRSVSGPYASKKEASDAARKFNRERALRWGAPYQGMDMQDAEKHVLAY